MVKKYISKQGCTALWNLVFAFWCLTLLSSCEPKEIAITDGVLSINGSDTYYKTMGEGEPLFIVHGGPTLDHSYFLPHLEVLARNYKLIFYDQRASGKSSVAIDSSTMNLKGLVDDIDLIRQELGYEKINLMGHSWGGLLAMAYGAEYAERLNHLILTNSMASNVIDWQAEAAEIAKRQTEEEVAERQQLFDELGTATEDRVGIIKKILLLSFKPQMFDKENLAQLDLYVPEDIEHRSRLFGWMLGPDIASFDFDLRLTYIECPTLLIYGESEPAVNIYANKLNELIPNSELEIIKESGHFPFIEQPDQFNQIVKKFLK